MGGERDGEHLVSICVCVGVAGSERCRHCHATLGLLIGNDYAQTACQTALLIVNAEGAHCAAYACRCLIFHCETALPYYIFTPRLIETFHCLSNRFTMLPIAVCDDAARGWWGVPWSLCMMMIFILII